MLMTLEDAKECWCPHARLHVFPSNGPACNRQWKQKTDTEPAHTWIGAGVMCVGNKCAAWRWATEKPIRDIDLVTGDVEKTKRLGYCGLSGPATHED